MTWQEREAADLIVIGDNKEEGQVQQCGGLLASVRPDPNPEFKNKRYELVLQNGDTVEVAGSASIDRKLHEHDVGSFVKITFESWGVNKRGQKFKNISVKVWDGELSDKMKDWPHLA